MAVKRLLCIVGGMNMGGAETFLMKIYRTIDKNMYQMDFAVAVETEGVYDKEILSMGGRIHHITPKSSGTVRNFVSIMKLVRKENYQYVLRISQHSLSALELLAAKLGGAKVRAFRSSNSNTCGSYLNATLHKICSFMPKLFANRYIAPSTESAIFMFGKRLVKSGQVCLLHNAVEYDNYAFNEERRQRIRSSWGVENRYVVGHIGRFNHQKNHSFLLNVFAELLLYRPDALLVLVGKGETMDAIKSKVSEMRIDDKVLFIPPCSQVNEYYSAFDVLIFPSKFEGMPNVLIEAQAASLPALASDTITKECKITDYISWLSLVDSPTEWATKAIEISKVNRISTQSEFIRCKYDIKDSSRIFCELIFG